MKTPPSPDWLCEAVALIPPIATYATSGALGVPLPPWSIAIAALASYATSRWLLMCTPTQAKQ